MLVRQLWKGLKTLNRTAYLVFEKDHLKISNAKKSYLFGALQIWNSIFLCELSEVYIIASFLLQSLIFYQHNINPNLPNDGYLGKFLENSKLMFF